MGFSEYNMCAALNGKVCDIVNSSGPPDATRAFGRTAPGNVGETPSSLILSLCIASLYNKCEGRHVRGQNLTLAVSYTPHTTIKKIGRAPNLYLFTLTEWVQVISSVSESLVFALTNNFAVQGHVCAIY